VRKKEEGRKKKEKSSQAEKQVRSQSGRFGEKDSERNRGETKDDIRMHSPKKKQQQRIKCVMINTEAFLL
jgi:hypothetical protein